jgi:hypothetical protein
MSGGEKEHCHSKLADMHAVFEKREMSKRQDQTRKEGPDQDL